jgi:hypothetical protein
VFEININCWIAEAKIKIMSDSSVSDVRIDDIIT